MQLNVMIVDDSMVMRSMIRRTLQLSGLPLGEIHEAANGAEGLETLESHPIDLVLADLNMPVMDGETMIEHIRADADFAGMPILVVSTEGSFRRISLLRSKGAEFVHKPFTPETIREAVSDLTGVDYGQLTGPDVVPGSGPDF
jgi:two-component system chemotaxis response regulator CheY